MQNLKALLAIFVSLMLGMVAATLVSGCQPSAGPGFADNSTTGDELPATGPEISVPDGDQAAEKSADEMPGEEAPVEEKPAEEPASDKPAEDKASEEKPAAEEPAEEKPAAAAPAAADSAGANEAAAVPPLTAGDWNQWGGNAHRNNVPVAENVPTDWLAGKFDRKTGDLMPGTTKNVKWWAPLGSQTYGNTVVAGGKVFVGTNNGHGYLKRYPGDKVDLGCLIAFDEKDGKFLWQHSSEKLPTGRVHDWPLMGICCSPLVEGDRLWFVTSRGEVRCLDVDGFYDGTDDGRPESQEPARLFDVVRADDAADDKVGGYVTELDGGKLPADLRAQFAEAGVVLPEGDIAVTADDKAKAPAKKWTFKAKVGESDRDYFLSLAGPRLSAFKIITPDDKEEADVLWSYDMMKELGTSQHNMCSCSVTALGDILFVNTSNGVDEAHITIPAPDAPSFMAMDKNTGEVFWTDNSPGKNILHGQWSSPTVADIGGEVQVLFGGGDGWLYSFKANKGKDGKPELLWKFDINPKDTVLELGGRGTRNDIISTPVVYDSKVYFCTGQDPEHGEGDGILWCIDPTKRGDISEQLAVNRADPMKPIPVKRIQAVVEAEGDIAIDNPNSGVVWKYVEQDNNGDGEIDDFLERFHRSISTVAIKDDLLFCPDFSGCVHCLDAQTGKVHWTYDMLAAMWGSPLIAGDKVYIGDEDGDLAVFGLSADRTKALKELTLKSGKKEVKAWHPLNCSVNEKGRLSTPNLGSSVYSTPIVANGVLWLANKERIFAVAEGAEPVNAASSGGE